jgi:hypothetical protein
VHECKNPNKTKVKVKKWIDTPNLQENKAFILNWHYFIDAIQNKISTLSDEAMIKKIDLFILQHFYMEPYHQEASSNHICMDIWSVACGGNRSAIYQHRPLDQQQHCPDDNLGNLDRNHP